MKLVKEHINFERGLDPKEAMGIGMTTQWKEYLKTVANFDCTYVYDRDYKDVFCDETYDDYSAYIVRIIYHTISNIIYAKMPPQAAFEKLCEDEDIKKSIPYLKNRLEYYSKFDLEKMEENQQKVKRKIAEILEKKFSIKVNPDFVSESLTLNKYKKDT